jgi:hypothetical protein
MAEVSVTIWLRFPFPWDVIPYQWVNDLGLKYSTKGNVTHSDGNVHWHAQL